MSKITLLATAASVALLTLATVPASAACLDEVAQLEQRLSQIGQQEQQATAGGQQQQGNDGDTVEMEMEGGGEVEVTVDEETEAGTEPQENWFGSPPSEKGAQEQLQNAREMAEAGDEQGCMGHVEQARQIVISLEE